MLTRHTSSRSAALASRAKQTHSAPFASTAIQKYPHVHTTLLERPCRRRLTSAAWGCQRSQHGEPAMSPLACRSLSVDPVPNGLRIEAKVEDGTTEVEYDEENKVVRIPLSALGPEGQRRSKLVLFTCNKCGGRTARLVNPIAWEKGAVFGQCSKCKVWHVLSAPNKKIFEEVRYKDGQEPGGDHPGGSQSPAAAPAEAGAAHNDG
ncbi:hypothetical protein PLESTB_000374600 [Pleodorina starrii]|uniref:DNL-type domain-containing protein n=1 Tax=Pleodorina starrii TaxID=330485 RepID=A0A9W6EZ49_9CHLO|nr:hypothetical protein PLESTM_000020300 [Pleodorina starrii]GLC50397.1 hypothetical protein PLESTB_000374600 [Pleodorina starrii]GLC64222.1 hypothetical protein PLESTF_000138100 [Pleodorina starrii]